MAFSPLARRLQAALHLDDPPHRIALALAVGVFISCTPFWGFQTILAVLIAMLARLNRAATVAGAWLNLPWFAPFVYAASIKVGEALLPAGRAVATPLVDLLRQPGGLSWPSIWEWLQGVSVALLLGSIVIGAAAGGVTYLVALGLIVRRRAARGAGPSDDSSRRDAA
jgi:uncharacterized protein (DUF2062 family)